MVPLFTLFTTALAAVKRALAVRAARFEKKFTAAAYQAELAAREMSVKPGNAAAADRLTQAKRQYELGRLVQHRDALEAKYVRWQARAEATGKLLARLRGWKGRAVPYLFGVADVALVVAGLHYAGVIHGPDEQAVREWVAVVRK